MKDLLDGPVVKNPPANAEDTGSIPGRGTETPRAAGQLSPCVTTAEPTCPESVLRNQRSHGDEEPEHRN